MQLTKGAIGNLINRYKAVLKKCHLMNTFGSLAVAGMLVMGGAGMAVAADPDVALKGQNTYDSEKNPSVNHLMGGWLVKDAATAGDAKGDITLTVNGGNISEIIGGSYAKGLTANGESLLTVKHGDITTTISGDKTTSAEFVVGGSKVAGGAGANLETGNISLTINDGTFGKSDNTNAYELVMGGNYLKASTGDVNVNNTAAAENITVNIRGGKFDTSVTGGSVAHVYGSGDKKQVLSVTDASTSVTITGGTFNPSKSSLANDKGGINLKAAVIGGGLAYGANTSSVLDAGSSVTIDGEKTVVNGKVVAGSVVAEGGYAAVVHGNTTLTMQNGTVSDDLIGGGMVQDAANLTATTAGAETGEDPNAQKQPDHNLIVTGNAGVTVAGGTATGEIVGGNYVRGNGSARVENSSVTITSGTFSPDTANKAQYVIGGNKSMAYTGDTAKTLVEKDSGVLVDGAVKIVDGAVVGGSMAKAENDGKATATVEGNSSVTVNNATSLAGVVGGGIAETYYGGGGAAVSEVKGTSFVAINGGTIEGIAYGAVAGNAGTSSAAVVGGGMANGEGASASVTNTNVSITGGTIDGKVVAGGLAINGGTTTVKESTLLTMTGGEVTGDLIGGNLLEKNGEEDSVIAGSTVNVESGTVAGEIYGGSYVRNTAGTSEVANTTVNISGGTIGAKVPQGWAQYVVGGGKAMSNATTTESSVMGTAAVNISGGDITRGAVVGGGFARAQGASGSATANVEDSVVNLTGGSLVGVVGGGLAENLGTTRSSATATVTATASLTIDGNATVNGIIYKGNDGEDTSSSAAVIGGGLAYSKNGSKAIASVETANTTINGGTINGGVYAGGMADGTGAKAEVTNANLTIKGGTINGNVYAGGYALNGGKADVTTAIITLDGTGAKVNGDFEGNTTSTLTFNNYDDKFNNAAYGFGTLNVAEGSNVRMDAVVSGKQGTAEDPQTGFFGARHDAEGSSNPITITGGGTITAKQFHVSTNANVTIAHGNVVADDVQVQSATLKVGGESTSASLTVNEKLIIDKTHPGNQNIDVENLGTLTLGKNIVLDENGELKAEYLDTVPSHVKAGGTLKINGLDGKKLTDKELASLQGLLDSNIPDIAPGEGLLDLGGADLGVTPGPDGTVNYDKVQGITTNSLKDTTVAVTDAQNKDGISGGFQAVKLTGDDTELNAKGTLVLAGSQNGGELVINENDTAPDLRVGGAYTARDTSAVTLGLADANNSGTVGTVTLNAGTDNKATLNVIGAGAAEFTIGDIRANESTNTINVAGATLNTGNITTESGTKALDKLNITSGIVNASGNVNITDVALANGVLTANEVPATAEGVPATGDITLGTLSGQGSVVADNALTVTDAYNGADTDALGLQADTLTTADFDSTKGDVVIKAAKWDANGATTLKGDAVELTKAGTFTDVFAMDGGTLVAQSGDDANLATLTFNGDATFTNGAVAVVDSIKMDGNDTSLIVGEAKSDGVSLVVKEMTTTAGTGTLTFDPDWGYASNNVATEKLNYDAARDSNVVNNHLQVGRNSYVALGTTDKGWLPSVVQGGLREDGVETVLGLAKPLVIDSTTTSPGVVTGSIELNSDASYGGTWTGTGNTATFGDNSLLVVDGNAIFGDKAAITFNPDSTVATDSTLKVAEGAKLLVTDAVAGQTYTIVDKVASVTGMTAGEPFAGWKTEGLSTTTDMISLGDAKFDSTNKKVTTSAVRNDAHTVFPNLSDGMANAVNDLYTGRKDSTGKSVDYADVNSDQMGVRFLSRATDNRFLGADKEAAAATIESAARIAFAGAVPQMTKMASDAGSNAVVNRLGFANPADGAQAMDAEGKIVDRNTTGFALWIAPLWQSQHGWGMEADNLDYGFNGNLGGVSLGADYTFENAIRAGITFNIGGGYAESSGGDLNSTENRMSFWGLGAYAGWNYENFGLMADVSYTSTWNDLKQDMDSRMGMGDLEADVQATAISAGLRAEYLLQTSAMDIIPHIGVRYMSLNTWGFDAESNGGTVLEGDGFHQDIWTFPVGVTFTKDFTLDSGWSFKPSIDFSVIPAAGDIKAKQDVAFTGLPGSYEVETQMMDYLTWQGGVGLELGNDTMSFGVNYTLQAGQHTTGHGVFGSFRYEF